jgi:hypothetical protein
MSILDGLTAAQRDHARVMIGTVYAQQFPQRAAVIVMETALVESGIQIYANPNVPESMAIPHEAVGSDHASVGILQQQVPYWGTAADCMDPATSTVKFLFGGTGGSAGLNDFDWQHMTTGEAAQAVQVSAYPDRYQLQEQTATQIVEALWPTNVTPDTGTATPLTDSSEDDEMKFELIQVTGTDAVYAWSPAGTWWHVPNRSWETVALKSPQCLGKRVVGQAEFDLSNAIARSARA